MALFEHERTSAEVLMIYALYLYFLGQSFRNTSKALEPFDEKRRCCRVEMGSKVYSQT
jgi:hypothetical protein